MRLGRLRLRTEKIPYLPIFLVGLVLGIFAMNAGKGLLLENTGLLDEYTLYQMKYMTVDGNALFFYVLGERLKGVGLLVIMATTYLGLAVICGMALWYGMASGMFLSALIIRYGMKGILFALTGIFPQYLLYVPAVLFLFTWCEQICRSIYFTGTVTQKLTGRQNVLQKLLQLLILIGIVIVGCVLESYVNPYLVGKLLKIF